MVEWYGALVGLALTIFLILKKTPVFYGMLAGALVGGLVGGLNIQDTVTLMVDGAKGVSSPVLRILAAGILAGAMIKTGAAESIAKGITKVFGTKYALISLVLSGALLTAVGVFVDVTVITLAPIALTLAVEANLSRPAILIAMIGGGKAGNIISPNPNTISASESFNVDLIDVMIAGIIPALVGIVITVFLAMHLNKKGDKVSKSEIDEEKTTTMHFGLAILGPLVAIVLLSLNPIADIKIDPLISLPAGGFITIIAAGKIRETNEILKFGISKMTGVAIMLIGTGALAGIVKGSNMSTELTQVLDNANLPLFILAPISGALMSFATASTTAGTTVASQTFGTTLTDGGVAPLNAAAMIHSGATVLDHMPHGSFFHATGGSVFMGMKERLKIMPYESLVGLGMTIASTIIFGFIA